MKLELVKGNLLAQAIEVVVASANNDLILGGGITGEIRRTAGPTVQAECEAIGTIPLGMVAVTGAGELKFKHIFHAAVKPIGLFADAKSIRSAIRNCFREATKRQIKTIGFPAIGSGGGSFPVEKSIQIFIEEMLAASKDPAAPEKVLLVIPDEKALEIADPILRERVPADFWVGGPPPPLPPKPEPTIEPPAFGAR